MSKPTTIPQVIANVLRSQKRAMTPRELYNAIVAANLYAFKA